MMPNACYDVARNCITFSLLRSPPRPYFFFRATASCTTFLTCVNGAVAQNAAQAPSSGRRINTNWHDLVLVSEPCSVMMVPACQDGHGWRRVNSPGSPPLSIYILRTTNSGQPSRRPFSLYRDTLYTEIEGAFSFYIQQAYTEKNLFKRHVVTRLFEFFPFINGTPLRLTWICAQFRFRRNIRKIKHSNNIWPPLAFKRNIQKKVG